MRSSDGTSNPGVALAHAAIVLTALLAHAPDAVPGPLTISRWTVDGGGVSRAEAGAFALWGTAGQPDAGTLEQSSYRLGGGFWGLSASPVVGVGNPSGDPGGPPPGPDPAVFELRIHPAVPNPVFDRTRIAFELPSAGVVDVKVFGVDGGHVRTLGVGVWPPGRHDLVWDGRDEVGRRVDAGLYFVRVRVGTLERSMKLAVMR